jgi:phosphotransferase system IIB component
MEAYLRTAGPEADAAVITASATVVAPAPETPQAAAIGEDIRGVARAIAAALGGSGNILELDVRALTRLRVRLRDDTLLDEAALRRAGVAAIMRIPNGALHLIVGLHAPQVAAAAVDLLNVQSARS